MAQGNGDNTRSNALWGQVRKTLQDAGLTDLPDELPDVSDSLSISPRELIAAARSKSPTMIDRLLQIISPELFPDEPQRQGLIASMIRHLRPELVRHLRGTQPAPTAPGGDQAGGSDSPASLPSPRPSAGRPAFDWQQVYAVTPTALASDAIDTLVPPQAQQSPALGSVPGASVITTGAGQPVEQQQRRTAREVMASIGHAIHQRMRGSDASNPSPTANPQPAHSQPAANPQPGSVAPSPQPRGLLGQFTAGLKSGFTFVPRMAAAGLRRAMQSVAYRAMIHPTLAQHVHGLWRIEQAARHADHGQPATAARHPRQALQQQALAEMTATPAAASQTTSEATPQPAAQFANTLALPAAPAALANVTAQQPGPPRSGLIRTVAQQLRGATAQRGANQSESREDTPPATIVKTVLQSIASTRIGRTMLGAGRTALTMGRRRSRQAATATADALTTRGGMLHSLSQTMRNETREQRQRERDEGPAGITGRLAQGARSTLRFGSTMGRRRMRQMLGTPAARAAQGTAGRAAGGVLGRLGAGLAGRAGLAGMGGAAAGGGGAAAAGLGVAGIVGMVAGVAAFASLVTVALTPAMRKFAEHLNEGNRHLTRYNGSIAAAFARLDIGRFQRERMMGMETSTSSVRLSDAVNEMEEAFHPISKDLKTLINTLAFLAAKAATGVAAGLAYAKEHIPYFEDVLAKIEENTKPQNESQFAWQLLERLQKSDREQRLDKMGQRQRQAIDPLWRG